MTLIVDRTESVTTGNECEPNPAAEPHRERIDVTDLPAAGIESFVQSSVDTDYVSLEHRGAQTYLVLEE
ncbi:hypothetical protein ACLI4Z_04065 [Natrialbaceae archaeon A-arb3/5]